MSTTSFKPVAAEPVNEESGLIHGVSAQELQVIGEQCIDAKTKAYCMFVF
jgi:cytidine deaminase